MTYKFEVQGTDALGYPWMTTGTIEAADFLDTQNLALRASFQQLTQGKAQYGKPGFGCRGPYRFTRLLIEVVSN